MLPRQRITEESAAIIRALDRAGLQTWEIASLLDVDPDGVGEVLRDQRFPGVAPACLDDPCAAAFLCRAACRLPARLTGLLDMALDPDFRRQDGHRSPGSPDPRLPGGESGQ